MIDAAGAPELGEDLQQLAVLVEFLDAIVPAVADIKMARLVHRHAMRHFELAAIDAVFAPLLDELAAGVEFHHPGIVSGTGFMAVADEDGAAGRHQIQRSVH